MSYLIYCYIEVDVVDLAQKPLKDRGKLMQFLTVFSTSLMLIDEIVAIVIAIK